MPAIDLKQLERKAFTATFQDGLWDLFIASMALGFAITPFINRILKSDFWSAASVLPLHLLVLAGVFLGKKYLTAPRLGSVKFAPARVRQDGDLPIPVQVTKKGHGNHRKKEREEQDRLVPQQECELRPGLTDECAHVRILLPVNRIKTSSRVTPSTVSPRSRKPLASLRLMSDLSAG